VKRQLFVESLFRNAQDLVTLKIPWRDDIIIFVVSLVEFVALIAMIASFWLCYFFGFVRF